MNINKIGYQPNFNARFKNNETMMEFTKHEIENGNGEELEVALKNLSKMKTNLVLELSNDKYDIYTITNLYNNKKVTIMNMSTDVIHDLCNPKTRIYKNLFSSDKQITPSKAERLANMMAARYYVKKVPDYTYGHIIDENS